MTVESAAGVFRGALKGRQARRSEDASAVYWLEWSSSFQPARFRLCWPVPWQYRCSHSTSACFIAIQGAEDFFDLHCVQAMPLQQARQFVLVPWAFLHYVGNNFSILELSILKVSSTVFRS